MSHAELILRFPDADHINVAFEGNDSGPQPFTNPVTEKDRADIRWYIETYGSQSLDDPDDAEAARIEARLPEIGRALFKQVFTADEARDRYKKRKTGAKRGAKQPIKGSDPFMKPACQSVSQAIMPLRPLK